MNAQGCKASSQSPPMENSGLKQAWVGPLCPRCDHPEATALAWAEIPEGQGEELCWGAENCDARRKDWRAEALLLRGSLGEVLDQVQEAVSLALGDLPDEAAQLLALEAIEGVRLQIKAVASSPRA
jgi:hypothetical protein